MSDPLKDKLSFLAVFPIQVVVYFGSILLVEMGTYIHQKWKRQLGEDIPTY